ncbi:hypothetical protein NBM05_08345 [Rothia sp. AR01]|uniref:Uncharacterized protein n=1 Tax=Rothia santali TaxID=2949643 RepID=A0A9X2KIH1_9MICC|nr:hypothetical protein [Rothia santali]MCP3426010.1 hypothetical protein [Rothia santali]
MTTTTTEAHHRATAERLLTEAHTNADAGCFHTARTQAALATAHAVLAALPDTSGPPENFTPAARSSEHAETP